MRRACALAVGLLAAPLAPAQTTVGARLGGVYAAPVDADEAVSGRAGAGLVAFAERAVRPWLALGAEAGVLQGGFTQEITAEQTPGEPGTLRARVTVFTLAPTVTVGVGRGLRPELFAGPRLDVRLAESGSLGGQAGRLEEYDDTMLGLAAGAGVRLPVGLTTLRLDARVSRMRVTDARSELQTELRVGLTL